MINNIFIILCIFLISSCANTLPKSETVSINEQKQQFVLSGVIKDVTKVLIEEDSELSDGSVKKEEVELLIEINSDNSISIIQKVGAYSYFKNQKVRVIKNNGKSRVIPFE